MTEWNDIENRSIEFSGLANVSAFNHITATCFRRKRRQFFKHIFHVSAHQAYIHFIAWERHIISCYIKSAKCEVLLKESLSYYAKSSYTGSYVIACHVRHLHFI